MTVEERRRIELFEQLVPLIGEQAANTMLELLPPPGQDVATKDDIADSIAELRAWIESTFADRAEVRALIHSTVADSETRIREDMAHFATKADIYRIFTAQTAALAAVLAGAAAFFG